MKKFLSMTIILTLAAAGLAGCSGGGSSSNSSTTVQTTQSTTAVQITTSAATTAQPTTEQVTMIQPTTEQSTTVQPTTAEPTTVAKSADDYVGLAREETHHDQYNDDSTYRMPKILIDSAEVQNANADIVENYDSILDRAVTITYSMDCNWMDYEYYLNDNILSLIITRNYSGTGNLYGVYNIDVATGEWLDSEEFCNKLLLDYDTVMSDIKSVLQSDFDEKYGKNYFPPEYSYEYYLEKNLDEENIRKSYLYLNEGGDVCVVCSEYAPVGGEYFEVCLKIY